MNDSKTNKGTWFRIPPWFLLGAVIILVPIFVFWTLQNIHKQKENVTRLLLEKGAALIRSFEAGTRTGMMGMMGSRGDRFQLQKLLIETAQQSDIVYLIVTDTSGNILADSDPDAIGGVYGRELDLEDIARQKAVQWRQISNPDGSETFEVFRRFSPSGPYAPEMHSKMMMDMLRQLGLRTGMRRDAIIFVGLDMEALEGARKEDAYHTVVMALILLLIGFAGIFSLFVAQAYRSARVSLTRIKAFSDNVVENMPIGLVAVDADGKIASFNQRGESVLQLTSSQILGRSADEVLPAQLWSLTDGLESKGGVIERDIECALKNGKMMPLEASVSLLSAEDDTSLGHIILFRDLTEVQDLKREVERSRRLASLGRLAAGIAHEIRNPLSSIKGFATYFKERYRDIPEDQKTADVMIHEVDRLNRVIGQLLEFARPMTIERKPISIQGLIQHSLKIMEGPAREKNIEISTDIPPDLKEINVDSDRINQVLLNLYLNAIDAMEEGGRLHVAVFREEESQELVISVSDNGVGINEEDLVHIFDPYFTTKQSGTGLGLAIVHNIIESHKGEVRVESERGRGTTVRIFLPDSGA